MKNGTRHPDLGRQNREGRIPTLPGQKEGHQTNLWILRIHMYLCLASHPNLFSIKDLILASTEFYIIVEFLVIFSLIYLCNHSVTCVNTDGTPNVAAFKFIYTLNLIYSYYATTSHIHVTNLKVGHYHYQATRWVVFTGRIHNVNNHGMTWPWIFLVFILVKPFYFGIYSLKLKLSVTGLKIANYYRTCRFQMFLGMVFYFRCSLRPGTAVIRLSKVA